MRLKEMWEYAKNFFGSATEFLTEFWFIWVIWIVMIAMAVIVR